MIVQDEHSSSFINRIKYSTKLNAYRFRYVLKFGKHKQNDHNADLDCLVIYECLQIKNRSKKITRIGIKITN